LTGKVVGSALVTPSCTWRTLVLPFYRCASSIRSYNLNAITRCDLKAFMTIGPLFYDDAREDKTTNATNEFPPVK
jgi:hypothetical protein